MISYADARASSRRLARSRKSEPFESSAYSASSEYSETFAFESERTARRGRDVRPYNGPISWAAVSRRSAVRPLGSSAPRTRRSFALGDEPPWPDEYRWEARESQKFGSTPPARSRGRRQRESAPFEEEPVRARGRARAQRERPEEAPKRSLATWLRKRRRAKADRAFDAVYGGVEPAAVDDPGPRAALYETKMGRRHREATRKVDAGAAPRSFGGFHLPNVSGPVRHPKAIVGAVVAACLVFSFVFLYGPARTFYQQMREHDRLAAELAAVTERNETIQRQIDELSTDSGVETRARSEFGWVKEGEQSVSAAGIEHDDTVDITGNVMASDIDPPTTWYSGLLDPLFGVD